ncbi:MAG: cupin domain-containing protein [Nitrospira sp.]
MATLIHRPTIIAAAGMPPKQIAEYVGRRSSATEAVSIAHMVSPGGWSEPGQQPEFDEFTVVLRGVLAVDTHAGTHEVRAGQAVIVQKGEWVRYRTPDSEGAEYLSVCRPAFSPALVRRDAPSAVDTINQGR